MQLYQNAHRARLAEPTFLALDRSSVSSAKSVVNPFFLSVLGVSVVSRLKSSKSVFKKSCSCLQSFCSALQFVLGDLPLRPISAKSHARLSQARST